MVSPLTSFQKPLSFLLESLWVAILQSQTHRTSKAQEPLNPARVQPPSFTSHNGTHRDALSSSHQDEQPHTRQVPALVRFRSRAIWKRTPVKTSRNKNKQNSPLSALLSTVPSEALLCFLPGRLSHSSCSFYYTSLGTANIF